MTQSRQQHQSPLLGGRDAYTAVTDATYTAKAGDRVIGVNRAGAVTITLPSAEVRPGRSYTIKDESGAANSNNITVATEGSETIDGSATDTISDNYGGALYYSDGSNWFNATMNPPATAHQSDHNSGGGDPLRLDDLNAPEDNTDLDFSTSLRPGTERPQHRDLPERRRHLVHPSSRRLRQRRREHHRSQHHQHQHRQHPNRL